jgi:hypothetical protein
MSNLHPKTNYELRMFNYLFNNSFQLLIGLQLVADKFNGDNISHGSINCANISSDIINSDNFNSDNLNSEQY